MTKDTIFSLPRPVRNIIWEKTLIPQVISLQYRRVFHAERDNVQYTFPIRLSPQAGDICAFLYILCTDISPIASLCICQESRNYALSQGYRAWELQDKSGRTRRVMWNPVRDTVFFDGLTQNLGKHFFYDDVIAQQFPAEVMQVRFLAVLSSHWPCEVSHKAPLVCQDRRTLPASSLQFKALSEICVVLDAPYESGYVRSIKSSSTRSVNIQPPLTSWRVPDDIEKEFRMEKENLPESDSNVPKVRFVRSQDRIVNGSRESGILRCSPCPDLFKLMD